MTDPNGGAPPPALAPAPAPAPTPVVAPTRLGTALLRYSEALATLAPVTLAPGASAASLAAGRDALLAAILARDAIATLLARRARPQRSELGDLTALDETLALKGRAVAAVADKATWKSWRSAMEPAPAAWWWRLDERSVGVGWPILGAIAFVLSVSVLTDVARRWFASGPDVFNMLSMLVTVVLTTISGASFFKPGKEWLESRVELFGAPLAIGPRALTLIALLAATVSVGTWLSLSWVSQRYNASGMDLYRNKQFSRAYEHFRKAVDLNPDNVIARYHLARSLEESGEYDKAIVEYHGAIREDAQFVAPYISLAHVYIRHKKDFVTALRLVTRALEQGPDDEEQYQLYHYRAEVFLALNYLSLAEADARRTLIIRPEAAAPHCVLAMVHRSREQPEIDEWQLCLSQAHLAGEMEAWWLSLARARILEAKK